MLLGFQRLCNIGMLCGTHGITPEHQHSNQSWGILENIRTSLLEQVVKLVAKYRRSCKNCCL
jgi:hypothetical protein